MNGWDVCPETLPSPTRDRASHLAWLALSGYPQLAADTILNKEIRGKLRKVVGNAVRLLNLQFMKDVMVREKCYETLVEVAFNLVGVESKRVGFLEAEADATFQDVVQALKTWERLEREEGGARAAKAVIQKLLQDMKQVLRGESMLARMAEEIAKEVEEDNLMESFILSAEMAIEKNVYYRIVTEGLSRLGNDSATGLRRVRHLGAVQVSSNPVIAARAYEELPDLWVKFKEVVKGHPEWFDSPERFGDEVTLYGTITSLLSNLLAFRPIALLSEFHDGLVSYQLNPFLATSREPTVKDAMRIYSILHEILERYDAHLMWSTEVEGRGRPNIVFKVAGCAPEAIEITEALNRIGIGTNDTVTYTVAQEVTLAMAAMKGLAEALSVGILITQVYITNMMGRLEDHLREIEVERLLQARLQEIDDKEAYLRKLAEELGALEKMGDMDSLQEKVRVVCSKKYLKVLTDPRFVRALQGKAAEALSQLEEDIEHAGVFVTRKVYKIFFDPKNKLKWIGYVQRELEVSEDKAREVMDKVDVLASSKRRAEDTYLVLGGRNLTNLTNTEFPNQQLQVWEMARREGFRLSNFENAIMEAPDPAALERLLKIRDFRKAYELTPGLVEKLRRVGIKVDAEEGGVRPEEWPTYGPVVKTMEEFTNAYLNFKQKLIDFLHKT